MPALLIRLLPYILVLVGALYWHWSVYDLGYEAAATHYEAKLAAQHKAHVEAWRAAERKSVEQMTVIDQQHQEEIQRAIQERDDIISDLRAGNLRLRERFTCPSPELPGAGPAASGGDAGESAGLQPADAEFLIRLAAEADEVTRQLAACQAVIRADRESIDAKTE